MSNLVESKVLPEDRTFLSGTGEMRQRIRDYPWCQTELGPPEAWPQSLKTVLRIALSSGYPMFIWWGEQLVQFYNDAYREYLGEARHPVALAMPGKQCWADVWEMIGPQIEYVMSGLGPTWDENRWVPTTRHGVEEDAYWTYSYTPIDEPNAPNGVGGVLVVCSETTKMVLAERQSFVEKQRWQSLFDQSAGFMCILKGKDHTFEYVNPKYQQLIGNRKLLGKPLAEALPEVVNQGFIALLDEVFKSGKTHHGEATPVKLQTDSGNKLEQRYVDFVYQPLFDDNNAITGVLVDGYDVTERVLVTEKIQQADKRKDEFLAMLAHELRNPLAPIRNAAEWLIRSQQQNPELAETGAMLARQITHLTHLVDDLLDISRITRGKITLQRNAVSLSDALDQAIDTVLPDATHKGLKVALVYNAESIHVQGDLTRLVQCFINLLNNAVKYSERGVISVELSAEDQRAMVSIRDQGIGIPTTMLDSIFELFVQVDNSLDRAHGGLGIGLSLVKIIIEMHGGTIKADSKGAGLGSEFTITLPRTEAVNKSGLPTAALTSEYKSILIVDDNMDGANSLQQLLTLEGHKVKAVFSSKDALLHFAEHTADVVLMDIGLPELNGYELAKLLRAQGFKGRLIAITGYGQMDDIKNAELAGFDHHMIKPVVFSTLLDLINK